MVERLQSASEVVGALLVVVGLAMAWIPLGVIAAGAVLLAAGNLPADRRGGS